MDKFTTLKDAESHHEEYGGILLIMDSGEYGVCSYCPHDGCGECGRSVEWLDSLGPSFSEAAPENMRCDPRNRIAANQGLKIAQLTLI